MKIIISASIDGAINNALISYCERKIEGDTFRRSKSEVVNAALKEYFVHRGIIHG